MKTYTVTAGVVGSKYIGTFRATTPENALKRAQKCAGVSLCHECSSEVSDPEIESLTVLDEDGNEVARESPWSNAAEAEQGEVGVQLVAARAELERMRAVVREMRDLAEYDCEYGDNCPPFDSRHGTCVGCKARKALERLDAHPGLAKPEGA